MEELFQSLAVREDLLRAISLTVLLFGRLSFAVFFTPFFGGKQIPARVKIGATIALVLVLYPGIAGSLAEPLPLEIGLLLGLFMKEAFVGLILGILVALVFYGIQGAGQFIDDQRGVSQAVIFNPALGGQASLTSQFMFQMAVVLFFISGGHRLYVRGIFRSFEVLPVVAYPAIHGSFADPSLGLLINVSMGVFSVALQLAAPVVIAMFLVEVVLGFANRVAPQMDVLFISWTIKAVAGLAVILLCLHYIIWQMKILFANHLADLRNLVNMLPGV